MVNRLIHKGKKFLTDPQSSVLSAASIIMVMIVASRILGLIRQRTLAHFFLPDELALFFAAFRLPDMVFEVLVFGSFSSAFIPVFTKSLKQGNEHAWSIASTVVNLGLLIFGFFALVIGVFANDLYTLVAPGFDTTQTAQIAGLARILFAAQGFFVISYVLTGVLESLRRFLVPALAPLFYNIGIILGTVFLSESYGLYGPVLGVLIGALAHLLIQLPLAYKLGFRFNTSLKITEDVKKIGKLALPRIIEVSFLQISKITELFFASLITTASYTYYTFGNTLQLLPVGLFGTSIAKAALPTLASQADSREKFSKTLLEALYELLFLTLPIATILIVLRIPVIRLVYGTDIFDWQATNQTGYVLSAFAVSVVFQSANALLARSFYALHDTRTPVVSSIAAIIITVICDFIFIGVLHLPVWGLAAAFTIGSTIQSLSLFYLINKRILQQRIVSLLNPVVKMVVAAFSSGVIMWFLLKFFDRYVWLKQLSFLGKMDGVRTIQFEKFVLDTRYTINVIILSIFVSVVGIAIYFFILWIFKSKEMWLFIDLTKRIFIKHKVSAIPEKEQETVAPSASDTTV